MSRTTRIAIALMAAGIYFKLAQMAFADPLFALIMGVISGILFLVGFLSFGLGE